MRGCITPILISKQYLIGSDDYLNFLSSLGIHGAALETFIFVSAEINSASLCVPSQEFFILSTIVRLRNTTLNATLLY